MASTRSGSKSSSPKKTKSAAERSSEDFQRNLKTLLETSGDSSAGPTELLVKRLPEVGLSSPLILFGSQHIRARRIIDWIRERFFQEGSSEYIAYFGSELSTKKSLEPIAQHLLSPSLFSKESLLVIYDSDSVKATIAKDLAALLSTKSESTVVLLTAEDNSKKTSVAGLLGASAGRVSLSELRGPALVKWIDKEARQMGTSGFGAGAIELLIKYFGSDSTKLIREIEKLALLTPSQTPITKELVHQMSFHSPDVTSFELMQKIARRDVAAATLQALSLVDQGMHPMQISFFLSRCIRTLLARSCSAAKDQLAGEFTNYWFIKNLQGLERNFPEKEVVYCLEELRALDFNLKDSRFTDRTALSIAVQRLSLRSTTQHSKPGLA